jgi:hypothetical protein
MARQSGTIGRVTDVDLVVNCFERTYREVLDGDLFERIAAENRFAFASRTVLINNVDDRTEAQRRAQAAADRGAIDRYVFVADRLAEALARTGLTHADLGPVPYFTDWALVAVALDGPDWMLHWDADARLEEPVDWITPAIELMQRDSRVLVANPNWEVRNLDEFTFETVDGFALGHGFSDQVFLGRRSQLGRPIYSSRSLSLLRYPVAHLADIFEARVDAHLRATGRLRATHRTARYIHAVEMGTSWPAQSLRQRLLAARNRAVIQTLRRLPWRPRRLRQL